MQIEKFSVSIEGFSPQPGESETLNHISLPPQAFPLKSQGLICETSIRFFKGEKREHEVKYKITNQAGDQLYLFGPCAFFHQMPLEKSSEISNLKVKLKIDFPHAGDYSVLPIIDGEEKANFTISLAG